MARNGGVLLGCSAQDGQWDRGCCGSLTHRAGAGMLLVSSCPHAWCDGAALPVSLHRCWALNENMAYWWIIRIPILLASLVRAPWPHGFPRSSSSPRHHAKHTWVVFVHQLANARFLGVHGGVAVLSPTEWGWVQPLMIPSKDFGMVGGEEALGTQCCWAAAALAVGEGVISHSTQGCLSLAGWAVRGRVPRYAGCWVCRVLGYAGCWGV